VELYTGKDYFSLKKRQHLKKIFFYRFYSYL